MVEDRVAAEARTSGAGRAQAMSIIEQDWLDAHKVQLDAVRVRRRDNAHPFTEDLGRLLPSSLGEPLDFGRFLPRRSSLTV